MKVNLFEGGQVGKFSRPLPSPVTKSPNKTMSDTKVKFVALNGFTKIPESRVSESSQSFFGKVNGCLGACQQHTDHNLLQEDTKCHGFL